MSTPQSLSISDAAFSGVRSRLNDGSGLFKDDDFTYVLLDRTTHELNVLRRLQRTLPWTATVERQPSSVRASVNGQFFGPKTVYALATLGVVDPEDVFGEGSIREAGATIAENPEMGRARYFFGRNKDSTVYECRLGNPPENIFEGMGGIGPLIITNKVTGGRVRAGQGNQYRSLSKLNRPTNDDHWRDITQRNSNHFIGVEKLDKAFCFVGASHKHGVLILGHSPGGEPGSISEIRDRLFESDFECACFTDGSSSACLSFAGKFEFPPSEFKDKLIEVGFVGVRRRKPQVIKVTFHEVEVLNAGIHLGDQGLWDLRGVVNGEEFGVRLEVPILEEELLEGGATIELGWEVAVQVRAGRPLNLGLSVVNRLPPTLTGLEPPEITDFADRSDEDTDPPFGEGSWVIINRDGFYRLRYTVILSDA